MAYMPIEIQEACDCIKKYGDKKQNKALYKIQLGNNHTYNVLSYGPLSALTDCIDHINQIEGNDYYILNRALLYTDIKITLVSHDPPIDSPETGERND